MGRAEDYHERDSERALTYSRVNLTSDWARTETDWLDNGRHYATPRYGRARAVVGDTTAEQELKPQSEHLFQALISTPLALDSLQPIYFYSWFVHTTRYIQHFSNDCRPICNVIIIKANSRIRDFAGLRGLLYWTLYLFIHNGTTQITKAHNSDEMSTYMSQNSINSQQ